MQRRSFVLALPALALAACARPNVGADGLPPPQIYDITPEVEAGIPFRFLDGLNTLRGAAGAPPVQLDAQLNAAAATHSRDMALQNRPWHFGSDGSSPLDRLNRVGYVGSLIGETISESYETELETLAAWAEAPETREVLLDRRATRVGLAWFQEPSGKLWWTMVLGA
ncbi:divisome-associated lipoprotein DalA [Pseudoroseicyclus sp. H15]